MREGSDQGEDAMAKSLTGLTISQLAPLYEAYRRDVEARRPNTLRADAGALNKLVEAVGDIQPRNITRRHTEDYVRLVGSQSAALYNSRMTSARQFERWLHRERLIDRTTVLFDYPARSQARPDRHRVPVERFGELLDAAGRRHPRDRALVSVGLYLFLRASEIRHLRLSDVDLEAGELHVYIQKTDDYDIMPISAELDIELRRYLAFYEAQQGPLNPDWYLTPARASHAFRNENGWFIKEDRPTNLHPECFLTKNAAGVVQLALRDIGFQTKGEGVHTLRRSGARAYFDSLVSQGYDGALKRVSAMLHHASVTMTERYLGIREDRHSRNVALKGKPMFPGSEVPLAAPLRVAT